MTSSVETKVETGIALLRCGLRIGTELVKISKSLGIGHDELDQKVPELAEFVRETQALANEPDLPVGETDGE